jgi:hypothetical protein
VGVGVFLPMQTLCQHAYAITMPTLENSKISRAILKKIPEIPEKSPEIPEFFKFTE